MVSPDSKTSVSAGLFQLSDSENVPANVTGIAGPTLDVAASKEAAPHPSDAILSPIARKRKAPAEDDDAVFQNISTPSVLSLISPSFVVKAKKRRIDVDSSDVAKVSLKFTDDDMPAETTTKSKDG